MMIKKIFIVLAAVSLIAVGCKPAGNTNQNTNAIQDTQLEGTGNDSMDTDTSTTQVKEFTMTSFYEIVDGKPKPQFSIGEITVKKGDRVRIKVTNTKGNHDFVIDEYNIRQETPIDQEVVIEFVADQVGNFVYYCSKPSHRELGQWGTLRVTE